MKVIDLAEKQRNDEILPKHIRYENEDLYFDGVTYYDKERNNDFFDIFAMNNSALTHLYDEVEIIEEVEEDEFEDIEKINNAYYHESQDKINQMFKLIINDLIKNQKKIIEQLNYTEELESEIKHLKEEMKYREQDIEDNYKRISVEEQL